MAQSKRALSKRRQHQLIYAKGSANYVKKTKRGRKNKSKKKGGFGFRSWLTSSNNGIRLPWSRYLIKYEDKKACNLSTIGCTSFFPSKPLGCYGDGGAIFTDDDHLSKIFKDFLMSTLSRFRT